MQKALEKGTIAICFVHRALEEVRNRGLDVELLLAGAGISSGLLGLPQARVSTVNYSTLWRLINNALGDEFFGQDSRSMKVGTFAMLCHSVIQCRTLDQAIRRITRFFGLVLDDLSCELTCDAVHASLTLEVRPNTPMRPFAHETLLIMVHGLMCWLIGRRVPIRVARFAYSKPGHSAEYRLMFSPDLEFDQEKTAIVFDASFLELPVIQTELSLKVFLRSAPENVVLKYKNRDGLSAVIRRRLKLSAFEKWPTFKELAAQLNLTGSTLRRRLEEEGQSYQIIKDEMRRDKAIELLSHTALSVADIANMLGFAEPSAFHRAFKKWTGARTGAYRPSRQVLERRGPAPQAS